MTVKMVSANAQTKTLRILTVAIGAASVVFGILVTPPLLAQLDYFEPWWTATALAITVGVPVVLALRAASLPARLIRWIAGCDAVLFLAVFGLLTPALEGGSIPDAGSPWLLGISAIPATIAALAWRSWLVWTNLVAVAGLTVFARVAASDRDITAIAFQDGLYTLMFDAILISLALVALRSASLLDRVADSARAEAVVATAAQSRAHERERIGALVHDYVLATLVAASRAHSTNDRNLVASQAVTALDELETLQMGTVSDSPVPAHELGWALQAITTEVAPDAFYSEEIADAAAIDRTIVAAFSQAATEAIRNSLLHASHGDGTTNRALHLYADARLVSVTILDDGRGFDRRAVSESRLGITTSIVGRMERVGGNAIVVSEIGQGTRVALSWKRPDA